MHKKDRKKVPSYYIFRIFLSSLILYTLLVIPFVTVISIRTMPQFVSFLTTNLERTGGDSNTTGITLKERLKEHDQEREKENPELENIIKLFPRSLIFLAIFLLLFNIPFKVYFFKKRFGLSVSEGHEKYCRKFLLKSPHINLFIIMIPVIISHCVIIMGIIKASSSHMQAFEIKIMYQLLSVSVTSSLLTCLFVFLWLKYRVQFKYIEHVFPAETLHKRIYKKKPEKIRRALQRSSVMTTFMPMLIILTYVFLNVSFGQNIKQFSDDQISMLFGDYMDLIKIAEKEDKNFKFKEGPPNDVPYFYINMVDTALMFFGIFTGVCISIIYIFFFVGWTTNSIVFPIKELLTNMRKTGAGELEQYTIVRNNNEIGELTEGFNQMSREISGHIENIQNLSESYFRFVPKQFIQYLGKDDLTQVNLGDQVQKEMTILFSDIRNFTTLSEQMTPEENFDFINTFFGAMEPAISENGGFIDKYIGDAIMALFPGSADDAIRAAVAMRKALAEFNANRQEQSLPVINTGIGIHTGTLMLGIVGGPNRMEGTVISDAVNLASRLENLTKMYGASILISIQTLYKLSDAELYSYVLLDDVKVKGRKQAVSVYEILDGDLEEIKTLKLQAYEHIEKGIYNFRGKRFKRALTNFKKAQSIFPAYKVSSAYISRCEKVLDTGVPDDWSPIIYLDEK